MAIGDIASGFTGYMSYINVGSIGPFIAQIVGGLTIAGLMVFFGIRMLKYNVPVEIWRFTPHLQIETDLAKIITVDGIKKVVLMKNKKKQVDNFTRYPIKKGILKKTVNKIYLTEENGALRGLELNNVHNFFSEAGTLLNIDDVYYEDDNHLESLKDAELFTRDGEEVFIEPVPALAPNNLDSQNAFSLEVLDANAKYHIPTWYEKMQTVMVIMAGIMSAIIFLIMTRV